MKILINNYSYRGLTKALTDLGHVVVGHPDGLDQFNWWQHLMNENKPNGLYDAILREQILAERPDVYLCGKGWHYSKFIEPTTTEWIKKHVKATIYWSLDDPDFFDTFRKMEMCKGYDIALTCCGDCIPKYKLLGMDSHLFWPAWDEVEREPVPVVEEKDKVDFILVGTPYNNLAVPRKEVALGMAELGMSMEIWGPEEWIRENPKGFAGGHPSLSKFYKGVWKDWRHVHHLFAKARMNFSNHLHRATDYLNDRVPMVLGVGGFLFLDRQPGLPDHFIEGEHVVYFDSLEDLLAKAIYFKRHDEARNAVGVNARKLILERHTYTERAKQLLSILDSRGIK